jgi:poly-gamma-glutamate capsule biosynthesis protein CapA/YwtB (metallophosphatase superfamily)
MALAATAAAALSLVWGGDVTLGSHYGHPPQRGWPELAPVARVLRGADLAAVNYEGTFGSGGPSKCAGGLPNCFAFQAPPANTVTLRRAGVDVVNQANNHAHDFGAPGMAMTHAALRRADVAWTGAPGRVVVRRRRGVRVAFAGFSTYGWSAPMGDDAAVRALIRRAARRARIVVALFHAGAEGADRTHVPFGAEHAFGEYRGDSRHFAHVAIDAGADLVLGSGPHVLRGLQLYRGRLIAYSLGNLAGWRNFGTQGTTGISALLRVRLAPNGRLLHGTVTSLRLDRVGVPHPDASNTALRLMRSLSRADFGASSAFARTVGEAAP